MSERAQHNPLRVRIVNIRHGSPERERQHFIYARLVDAETGETLISATLDYILNAVARRGPPSGIA